MPAAFQCAQKLENKENMVKVPIHTRRCDRLRFPQSENFEFRLY